MSDGGEGRFEKLSDLVEQGKKQAERGMRSRLIKIPPIDPDPEVIPCGGGMKGDEKQRLPKSLVDVEVEIEERLKEVDKEIAERIVEDRTIIESSKDEELAEAAKLELDDLELAQEESLRRLKSALLAGDSDDQRRAIVEIRAGTGGEEAALFVADLHRMYEKYAEYKGWRIDPLNSHPTEIGGFKEVIFLVEGKGAYSRFKFESGVHRVQRVPATE